MMKNKTTALLCSLALGIMHPLMACEDKLPNDVTNTPDGGQQHEVMLAGPYEPTWESLSQFKQAPEWFRDAKFGMWAHWGPQSQPEAGDWYARNMYKPDEKQFEFHRSHYGHQSEFGFKDIINLWKGEKWDPEAIVARFKRAGARYFVAMVNHHDNFDLWDSKYQNWNSVNMGPKKNILAGWEKAARNNGLYFGVSVHSSHAWMFYEPAQGADAEGPKAGVPYDGKITKEDGKGTWWEGYDPQELYVQNHPVSENYSWEWGDKVSVPTPEYMQNFFDRNVDMINRYNPDLLYFDDTVLPFWPIGDQGMRVTAHLYNKSVQEHGSNQAVVLGKVLKEEHMDALVWDIERGKCDSIQEKPWQTCTCLGNWHYDRNLYVNNGYKPASMVIQMLIDIVSKNGNLLLSVPMLPDGSFDDKVDAILDGITAWMDINKGAIYGTRPWKIYGEGPSVDTPDTSDSEWRNTPYTSEDLRFVTKGDDLYVHALAWPATGNTILVKSLKKGSELYPDEISRVELLGSNAEVSFVRTEEGLSITLPSEKPNEILPVLKICK